MNNKSWGKYDPRWNDIERDVWNLKDEFTVTEAAALIANIDPSAISYSFIEQHIGCVNITNDTRPGKAHSVFQSLVKAIANNELKATFPVKEDAFFNLDEIPF